MSELSVVDRCRCWKVCVVKGLTRITVIDATGGLPPGASVVIITSLCGASPK